MERDVIDEYRISRNRVHLPAEFAGGGLKAGELDAKIEFLVQFVNNQVVARFLTLNAQLDAPIPCIKALPKP